MDLARSRITIASDKQSDFDHPFSARLGKCRAQIMPIPSLSSRSINKPPTIGVFVIDYSEK
jgi:hypothetical protein